MKAIRTTRGRFFPRHEARFLAAQVTSLPIAEPRMPDFASRPPHWHEGCEQCYPEAQSPLRGSRR